jgi:uncharacterized membrane protein YbhN (UPF0104 family)
VAEDSHPVPWLFVQAGGPRSRRPVDVALVAVGVAVALACASTTRPRRPPDLPDWVVELSAATYLLATAYAVLIGAVVAVRAPRQARLALTVLAAGGLAVAGWAVGNVVVGGGFPAARVAVVTGVLLVLRPWVVLTFRRLHAAVVVLTCLAAWASGAARPVDVVGAVALGTAAASGVLLLLGSPGGHPDLARVRASLRGLGVEVDCLRFADRQPWGARLLSGTSPTGEPLLVKVYGRDAADAHRAARWWRATFYRDQPSPGATRLQLVEHEALVTILAGRAGVPVTPVVAAASAEGDDAVLVLGAPPEPPEVDDAFLHDLWAEVAVLHRAGLCHGELTLECVGAGGVLSGFGAGSVAAPQARRAQEVATLLASTALQVGADRAVGTAVPVLGPDAVAAAQPYLQRLALPRSLRSATGIKPLLAELQEAITASTGIEPQPPAAIARVHLRDVVTVLLLLLAAYALLTTLVGLDWATVWDSWANASWGWILLGLVIAQGTSVADSVSTMSMVRTRLPLLPLAMLQYAIKFVGLAISATVGRIALTTSFLSRFAVGATVAVTASAMDSFAGAVANVVVVLVGLPFADNVPDLELGPSGDTWRLVVLLVVAVVVSAGVVAAIPRLRASALGIIRSTLSSVRVLTDSPSRGLLMLGSNFASLLITAMSMACMVQGIQPSLPFGIVLWVTAAAALFASIVPVPGNVGVAEAAITAGLVAVGVPSGPAFAIAVTQRISTSYLPDVFGSWALRWLRRGDYIA